MITIPHKIWHYILQRTLTLYMFVYMAPSQHSRIEILSTKDVNTHKIEILHAADTRIVILVESEEFSGRRTDRKYVHLGTSYLQVQLSDGPSSSMNSLRTSPVLE